MLREIVPGIYAIEGLKTGRAYLVDDADGLTLIDTSSPGAADAIIKACDEVRRPAWALKTIIATHYHYDHTGNVQTLRERTGATFYAHIDDVPYIDGTTPWGTGREPGFVKRLQPTPYALKVDRMLSDGDIVPAAGGLTVVHAPGHTPGHIALHSAERRVLFSGDAFMNTAGLRMIPVSAHDTEQARASVRKLAALEFDHALPGHGQPVLSKADEKLREFARRWL